MPKDDHIPTESLDYFRGVLETAIHSFVEAAEEVMKMAESEYPELLEDGEYQRMVKMIECCEKYEAV